MATLTLKAGIERIIKEEIPEVAEVIAVAWKIRVINSVLLKIEG
jgi:Fe-S cluster biogenesis protein NfuA